MDYLKQLNAYRRKRLASPLSSNAIALYTILLEYANDLYFPDRFTAANSVICGLSGLSLTRMQAARKELCDGGFLAYTNGRRDQCGTYQLIDLAQAGSISKKAAKPDGKPDSKPDSKLDSKSDSKPAILNKPNQSKPDQLKECYGDFVTLTPDERARLGERLGEPDTLRYIDRLNEYIGQIGPKTANKRYKSHYHTILSFYRRDAEKRQKQPDSPIPDYTASKGESL
ncbi:hypothetical protein [Eubacterium sp. 1001713B170207_170306_E7]|uniref:hypothetical protein n=1 Tax=Eubacterium sp. 1001713B170207_170306_E7 TaxID=2787097 RepID=UPI00189A967D|nr:hypothetical protein [Eubacterium sp. 1001713B170207_170306_E7]